MTNNCADQKHVLQTDTLYRPNLKYVTLPKPQRQQTIKNNNNRASGG